jgi:TolB-like protein/Tfp pilus assembly protein PilF
MVEFADALVHSSSDAMLPVVNLGTARSIAVLPFVNASPDPDNEYFSDGMTEELIDALAQVEGLHVASRTAVFALKDTKLDLRAVGARLGVSTVLEGSVRKSGSRLRILAQLTDVADGRLLWSERFDRDDRDVFAIQEDLARTIVGTLRANLLGTLDDPVPRRYTENLVAYNLYLRGRHAWNKRTQAGVTAAIDYFDRAIAEDPGYALAYTGLADSYALQLDYRAAPVAEGMTHAKEMAQRALALDDTLAEAHTSLAWVTFIYEWNWEAAGKMFRRAIDLNPRYATARQWYSWYLAALGRIEESLAEGRRAAALDTGSVSVQRSLGWLYYFARQPDRAMQQLRRALLLDPESNETNLIVALTAMQGGDLQTAAAALDAAEASVPSDTAVLAARARLAMLHGDVAATAAVAAKLLGWSHERYVSPTDIAKLYLARGDFDPAFAAIEQARAERRGWLAYLRVEPLLDPVRDDPRYATLLEQMRLAELKLLQLLQARLGDFLPQMRCGARTDVDPVQLVVGLADRIGLGRIEIEQRPQDHLVRAAMSDESECCRWDAGRRSPRSRCVPARRTDCRIRRRPTHRRGRDCGARIPPLRANRPRAGCPRSDPDAVPAGRHGFRAALCHARSPPSRGCGPGCSNRPDPAGRRRAGSRAAPLARGQCRRDADRTSLASGVRRSNRCVRGAPDRSTAWPSNAASGRRNRPRAAAPPPWNESESTWGGILASPIGFGTQDSGTPPPRIIARFAGSMLPPETTQTILPRPPCQRAPPRPARRQRPRR